MTTGLIGRVNGGFFQKCASYEIKDGAPSSFNWQTYFTFACRKGVDNNIYYSPLSLRKEIPVVAYYGNLILNFHYKFTEYSIADSNAESLDVTFPTDHTDTFRCLLKIGDYYYNGKSWVYDNVGNPQPFSIKCKYKAGDKVFDTLYSPENKVTFYLKLSDATDGIPIGLTNHILNGKIEFKLYPPSLMGTTYGGHTILNCHIQDLSLICTGRNHKHDIFGRELDNSEDIVYSNVIDEKNAIEGEERQLLVNSFTDGIVSYSNVATKEGDNFYYIKETNIYNGASDSRRLPEHLLIDKLYRHYSTPKFIYRNSLMYKFSPFDRIKENSLNKTLLVNSLSVDYANDSVDVTLIEL